MPRNKIPAPQGSKDRIYDLCNLENTDLYIITVALDMLSNSIKSNPTDDKMIFLPRTIELSSQLSELMNSPLFR